EEGIIDIYMTRANATREDIREKVDAETWFSAKSAVEIGFADKAEGTDEEDNNTTNTVLSVEDKQNIMNELKNILQTNNKKQEPSPNNSKGNGSFNLLRKWG